MRIRRIHRLDQPIGDALLWTSLGFQEIEREKHILRRQRRIIGKMRARIEMEGHKGARGVGLDGLSDKAVKRERLVLRARHQALIDISDQALGG